MKGVINSPYLILSFNFPEVLFSQSFQNHLQKPIARHRILTTFCSFLGLFFYLLGLLSSMNWLSYYEHSTISLCLLSSIIIPGLIFAISFFLKSNISSKLFFRQKHTTFIKLYQLNLPDLKFFIHPISHVSSCD